jgi:hypothetical protein
VAQEAAFDFANMLWRVLVIDVEATLKRAMHKVLNDRTVSEEARVQRARALRVLGNAFRTTCFAPRTKEIEVAGRSRSSSSGSSSSTSSSGIISSSTSTSRSSSSSSIRTACARGICTPLRWRCRAARVGWSSSVRTRVRCG